MTEATQYPVPAHSAWVAGMSAGNGDSDRWRYLGGDDNESINDGSGWWISPELDLEKIGFDWDSVASKSLLRAVRFWGPNLNDELTVAWLKSASRGIPRIEIFEDFELFSGCDSWDFCGKTELSLVSLTSGPTPAAAIWDAVRS